MARSELVEYETMHPRDMRRLFREGLVETTIAKCRGYVQAGLAIVPKEYALDFLIFCQRNPKACPVIDVTDPGDPEPKLAAPGADIRTDVPQYRVYVEGEIVDQPSDIMGYWRDDLVAFIMGDSVTFEAALLKAGVPVRDLDTLDPPMYHTSIQYRGAGRFSGSLVVSMRPIPSSKVARAVQVSSRFPLAHGAPVHVGNPGSIGIEDLGRPDYGLPLEIRVDDVPVFWACTPFAVARKAKLPLMIVHNPNHVFITDLKDEDIAVL